MLTPRPVGANPWNKVSEGVGTYVMYRGEWPTTTDRSVGEMRRVDRRDRVRGEFEGRPQ